MQTRLPSFHFNAYVTLRLTLEVLETRARTLGYEYAKAEQLSLRYLTACITGTQWAGLASGQRRYDLYADYGEEEGFALLTPGLSDPTHLFVRFGLRDKDFAATTPKNSVRRAETHLAPVFSHEALGFSLWLKEDRFVLEQFPFWQTLQALAEFEVSTDIKPPIARDEGDLLIYHPLPWAPHFQFAWDSDSERYKLTGKYVELAIQITPMVTWEWTPQGQRTILANAGQIIRGRGF